MKAFLPILTTVILTLTISTGCSNQDKGSDAADPEVAEADTAFMLNAMNASTGESVRKLIDSDEFIDVDLMKISQQIGASIPSETLIEDIAKSKAALYRFYKNVRLVDGYYVCDVKSGAEINVSEDAFTTMLTNMNESNDEIRKIRDSGEDIFVPDPEEYLESLLQ